MEQSPSWEANRFAASQEIPRILWKPKVHYRNNNNSNNNTQKPLFLLYISVPQPSQSQFALYYYKPAHLPLPLLLLPVSSRLMAVLFLQMFSPKVENSNFLMHCQKCIIYDLKNLGNLVSRAEIWETRERELPKTHKTGTVPWKPWHLESQTLQKCQSYDRSLSSCRHIDPNSPVTARRGLRKPWKILLHIAGTRTEIRSLHLQIQKWKATAATLRRLAAWSSYALRKT
jgi:hypothetical protein